MKVTLCLALCMLFVLSLHYASARRGSRRRNGWSVFSNRRWFRFGTRYNEDCCKRILRQGRSLDCSTVSQPTVGQNCNFDCTQKYVDDCASTDITQEERLDLIVATNDYDNSAVVNSTDVIYDVTNNYDTNCDGVWSEEECVRRWTCAYGDNIYTATYICTVLLSGQPSIPITTFDTVSFLVNGISVADFTALNQARYDYFNLNCVSECKTLEEKLQLNAAANDYNNDGDVTTEDAVVDLSTNYDTDDDGFVTTAEWVARWVCAYGDTPDFARYMWNLFFGSLTSLDISQVILETISTETLMDSNRELYENYTDIKGCQWLVCDN